jgi:hypothetical protein
VNHSIYIHDAKAVNVSVMPCGDFDVLKISIKSRDEYMDIDIIGGRWQVAEQTIRVTSDEEIAEQAHRDEANRALSNQVEGVEADG